jgi:hypothetical protein
MSAPQAQAPPPRDLTSEIMQTYRGQSQTALPYFNLESYFQPKYGQLALANQQQQLFGYDVPQGGTPAPPAPPLVLNKRGLPRAIQPGGGVADLYPGGGITQTPGHHPGTLELGAAANTFQRGADIGDVARYGPQATAAFLAANPFLAASLTNLLGRTSDSQILQTLNQQANEALAQGGQLSPQDIRSSDQAARAAYSARGLVGSEPAAAAEILNRDALMRQRIAAAQQLASGVQGLNQQQADLVGRASQIFSTTLSDPFQAILGRPSGAAGGGAGGGYPQQIGTGARLFDPMNPYAQDIYNTNYNAQAAANIANANNQAGQQSALIGGSLALGGSLAVAL